MVRVLLDANKDSVIASKCPVCGGYHLDEGDYRFKYDGLDYIKINCNGCMNLVYLILPGTTEVSMDKMAYVEEVIGSDKFEIVPYEEGSLVNVNTDIMSTCSTMYDSMSSLMSTVVNNPLLYPSAIDNMKDIIACISENCQKLSSMITPEYSDKSRWNVGDKLVLHIPLWNATHESVVTSEVTCMVVDIQNDATYLVYSSRFGLHYFPKETLVEYDARVIN